MLLFARLLQATRPLSQRIFLIFHARNSSHSLRRGVLCFARDPILTTRYAIKIVSNNGRKKKSFLACFESISEIFFIIYLYGYLLILSIVYICCAVHRKQKASKQKKRYMVCAPDVYTDCDSYYSGDLQQRIAPDVEEMSKFSP